MDIPIGGPTRVIVGRRRLGQAAVIASDAGKLPPAQHSLSQVIVRIHQRSAFAERQLPDSGGSDEVTDIKVRIAVPIALADRIDDEASTIRCCVLQSGSVVQRMGIGVVEVHRERF